MPTASIFSPRRSTMKLSGSFNAGCWGPMGTVTTLSVSDILCGSFRRGRRFSLWLPILEKRVVSLGPVLRQRVARHLGLAVKSRAQEVFHLALIDRRLGEIR